MQLVDERSRARKPARAKRGPAILAALIAGANIEEIGSSRRMSPRRVEKLLRDELRRRWVAPAQEYARLQIARLETMSAKLNEQAAQGDLPSIDRLLRILDRLDKYHGFTKLTPATAEDHAAVHRRLMAKLNIEIGKLPPPSKDEA